MVFVVKDAIDPAGVVFLKRDMVFVVKSSLKQQNSVLITN
jgi:hypothetical protein